MKLEEALSTALEFENRVRDVYAGAVAQIQDPAGKEFFQVLAREEQYHVDYLQRQQEELVRTGTVTGEDLRTAIPPPEKIEKGVGRLKARMASLDPDNDLQMLTRALEAELEASRYYKRIVSRVPADYRGLFARFMEIEEGHVAIVQAEIDALTRTGYWFNQLEIDLNGA